MKKKLTCTNLNITPSELHSFKSNTGHWLWVYNGMISGKRQVPEYNQEETRGPRHGLCGREGQD